MKTIAIFIIVLSSVCGLQGQTIDPYTIGQYKKIHSQILNEDRGYCVYLPHDYRETSDAYPVLYLLDGHRHFHYVSGMIDYMSRYPEIIPPMIVIDIDQQHRSRDMTPTKDSQQPNDTGGAEQFHKFLQEELIPQIDARYRTKSPRIIAGYSLSGLFVIHTLLNHPDTFNAYIAASPSIWWDNCLLVDKARSFFQHQDQLDKFLFFAVGDKERQVVQDCFNQLRQILERHKPAGFRAEFRGLENESHATICIPAFYLGLKTFFTNAKESK